MDPQEYQKLVELYKAKVSKEFGAAPAGEINVSSREYSQFKEELYPAQYTWYEQACKFSENLLKLKVSGNKAVKVQKDLDLCHLNTTPSGVTSFAILAALAVMVFGPLATFAIPVLFGLEPMFFFNLYKFCILRI